MTITTAKELKQGQRVRWADGSLGTVDEVSYAALRIKWDDGQSTLLPFGDERAPFSNIELVDTATGN